MTIAQDVQTLNPGALIELWELDATSIGGGVVRFQGRNDGKVWWQGNEYDGYPITAEGFAMTSDQQPTPKLRVYNGDGAMSILCQQYEDMLGAILIRRRTFGKYLDAVNFDLGNPFADPTQERLERWFLERKSGESRDAVEWELSSPLDFRGIKLPRRQIIANQCPWQYRGPGCAYIGPPVATEFNVPTSDPLLDKCSHTPTGCKLREWPDDVLNYGGFAAAGLVRI